MSEKDKEKKKIVFRVSFSNQENMPGNRVEPQMVTEWNYLRIAIAGLVLIFLIVIGIIILQGDEKSATTGNNEQGKQIKQATTKDIEPDTNLADKKQAPTNKSAQIYDGLVRAKLATGIWENEPFGKITGSIKVNGEEATGIFYFTELENMKGKAVFHIWKYKGEVIFKKKRDIQENSWKTYTSKLFTKHSVGPWTVETVDSNKRQLNVIHFDVVFENKS